MADTKISALTAASAAAGANEIPINEAGTTKKITVDQIKDYLGLYLSRLGTQFSCTTNSETMTEVTNLSRALVSGTYQFTYHIVWKTNDATNGIKLNVNYTGTSGIFVYNWRFVDVSATAATAAADQDNIQAASGVTAGFSRRAKATTAAGGETLSADTVNADMYIVIEGIFIATGAGDLELWAGNDAAGAGDTCTIEVGSSLILFKTA